MVSFLVSGPQRMRLAHRIHARAAGRAKAAKGFRSHPEPRTIGRFARGRQLLAGNIQFAGHLIEAPDMTPWELAPPDDAFAEEAHGFTWLDDLCAVGDARSREVASRWTMGWIDRFNTGQGPGWTPQLTARRVIRLINHAIFLLRGQEKDVSEAFFLSLGRQTTFLARCWSATPGGLPRIESVTGTVYAGLSLLGMEDHVDPAIAALCAEARIIVEAGGAVPSRNPQELLDVLTLLNWAVMAIEEADREVPEIIREAIAAIVPILRALRHADGGLARFHGGGRGLDGVLDQALATAAIKTRPTRALQMGYARLSGGRSTLVMDATPPPGGEQSRTAHASTLSFELTSGRRPVIVNCGSGAQFGPDWRRAGRATPSHSTLGIDGWSSSRIGVPDREGGPEPLDRRPRDVYAQMSDHEGLTRIETSHDGYRARFGVIHARTLDLTFDGRTVVGDDYLAALTETDKETFDAAMDANSLQGIPFSLRFHLHPDSVAELDLGGKAVSIALKSGEIWVLRHDSPCELALKPSVYLESGRLRPRATQQVVLSGRAIAYATQVRWSLAKAQDTPNAIRDVAVDDDLIEET